MKAITLQIDIGILVPEDIPEDQIKLKLNEDSIQLYANGKEIKNGQVLGHSNNGVVDSFSESEVENMLQSDIDETTKENLRRALSKNPGDYPGQD